MTIPLTKPSPPKLSLALSALQEIEDRGIYSNFGPVNQALEDGLIETIFNGKGHCTTTCNATLALMIAIRAVIKKPAYGRRQFALMPAFTFAAAAHAAMWCGLTPLFCDIDPQNWAADPDAEDRLLRKYGKRISVIVPYAAFGYDIDLAHYEALSRRYGVPVVVDAASSLGTISRNGDGFGAGSNIPIIFSMHATKSFSAGEGGVIYSADKSLIQTIRTMSNFGFSQPRSATMPGLNAKLSEVAALSGQLRLQNFGEIIERRQALVNLYRKYLPELSFQPSTRHRQAHQYTAALLPPSLARLRSDIQGDLAAQNISMGAYFSPHLAQQPYFIANGVADTLAVSDHIGSRIISLPLYDTMTKTHVLRVAEALRVSMARRDRADQNIFAEADMNSIFRTRPESVSQPLIAPAFLAAEATLPLGETDMRQPTA